MAIEDMEARIKFLEDIELIKKLKARLCYLYDAGDWQSVLDLFTEDAVADFGPFGRYEGKEIVKFYRDIAPVALPFTMHMCHNACIEVNGDKATGEWYFEVPGTHVKTNRAVWIAGKYTDEFVKADSEWKIKKTTAEPYYYTPYDEGWVKTKFYE